MTATLLNHAVTMDDLSADSEFITAAQFEDATRTVVRTLGKNHNLDVVFAGSGAKTNGERVILPAQDPTKMMTKKQYAVGQGFANHETMHNLCTDMPHFTKELARLKSSGKKLAMACANAVEDVRIEAEAAKLYPGIPSQISSTADFVSKTFLEEHYAKDPEIVKDFKRIGPVAITWRGRQRLGYDAPYLKKCLDTLSPEMLEKVDKWCDLIEKLGGGAKAPGDFDQPASHKASHRSIQLAETIANEIDEIEEEPEQEEAEGEGDGEGENKDGEGGKGNRSGGKGSSGCAELGGSEPEPYDPDMASMVTKLLTTGDKPENVRPLTTMCDTLQTKASTNSSAGAYLNRTDGHALYAHITSKIGSKTAVMKRKFERALLTASEADYVTSQRSGRLDVRRHGINIVKGRENVYRRKMDGKAVDTAVTILVDISGSMSGSKMRLASQVASALAECLDKTSVRLEILCFNGGLISDAFSKAHVTTYHEIVRGIAGSRSKEKGPGFHRHEPMNIWEVKNFDDSLRDARGRLGSMSCMAHGNNPDGDAIIYAAGRLKKQKASKHIMMVLSDGSPAYGAFDGHHEYTKKCTAYVTSKLGINLVGIGIEDDSVAHYYKNYTVVNDLNDLDKTVIDNVARMVLGENFKVDNADVGGIDANYKDSRRRRA